MRVWVIGRGLPDRKNGMLGSFEFEQAQMLYHSGIDVVYFAISMDSFSDMNFLMYSYKDANGIKTFSFRFPISRFINEKQKDAVYCHVFDKLSQYAYRKFGRPDIIHVHYPTLRPYSCLFKYQRQGIKIIATEHWSKVQDKSLSSIQLDHLHDFCIYGDEMICVGSFLRKSIYELTGTNKTIHILPNVVGSFFEPRVKESERFRFVACGRLLKDKQFDRIVEAFTTVFSDVNNVELSIVGNGKEYDSLKKLIEKKKMTNRIRLLGSVSRTDMASIMASANVLVSYSRHETFCVPVIEAWMCGIPVICSNSTPAAIDNQDDRLGNIVNCDNVEELERAMVDVYNNYDRFDLEWISSNAKSNYSEEAIAKRLIGIYESVVSL